MYIYYIKYIVYPITEKPNAIQPHRPFTTMETIKISDKREFKVNQDPIKNAFMKESVATKIKGHTQPPKDKFEYPQTANQEIGWFSKPLVNINNYF